MFIFLGNVLHYVCNSDGKILAGDMRIFDIEYTVATVLHSQHVKDNSISQVEKSLKKLTYGAPHIFTELEKTDIYLVASKLEGRDCILFSEYRSAKMKNYKAILINGNRMIIFTLLGCALIMLLFTVRFYMKQQKKVMKGQARYDILSEFSDTVLFEYDCLEKTLVFTPNITTLFGLKEIGPAPVDVETRQGGEVGFVVFGPPDLRQFLDLKTFCQGPGQERLRGQAGGTVESKHGDPPFGNANFRKSLRKGLPISWGLQYNNQLT